MFLAFEITRDDVAAVLSRLNPGGVLPDAMIQVVFDRLDHGAVEKAALYGDDMETQTEYAHDEIQRQVLAAMTDKAFPEFLNVCDQILQATGGKEVAALFEELEKAGVLERCWNFDLVSGYMDCAVHLDNHPAPLPGDGSEPKRFDWKLCVTVILHDYDDVEDFVYTSAQTSAPDGESPFEDEWDEQSLPVEWQPDEFKTLTSTLRALAPRIREHCKAHGDLVEKAWTRHIELISSSNDCVSPGAGLG